MVSWINDFDFSDYSHPNNSYWTVRAPLTRLARYSGSHFVGDCGVLRLQSACFNNTCEYLLFGDEIRGSVVCLVHPREVVPICSSCNNICRRALNEQYISPVLSNEVPEEELHYHFSSTRDRLIDFYRRAYSFGGLPDRFGVNFYIHINRQHAAAGWPILSTRLPTDQDQMPPENPIFGSSRRCQTRNQQQSHEQLATWAPWQKTPGSSKTWSYWDHDQNLAALQNAVNVTIEIRFS